MHHNARESWRRGIECREMGRRGCILLYCTVARSLNPGQNNDEVGEFDIEK